MEYQLCPECNGRGLVSRPSGLAGDIDAWSSASTSCYLCDVCDGIGILLSPNDKQPHFSHNETYKIAKDLNFKINYGV